MENLDSLNHLIWWDNLEHTTKFNLSKYINKIDKSVDNISIDLSNEDIKSLYDSIYHKDIKFAKVEVINIINDFDASLWWSLQSNFVKYTCRDVHYPEDIAKDIDTITIEQIVHIYKLNKIK